MLSFFEHTQHFARKAGGPNDITVSVDVPRDNPSPQARVLLVLKHFDIRFRNEDHHLMTVFVEPHVDGFGPFTDSVPIRIRFGLRDASNNWDDEYEGEVTLGLIVVDDDDIQTQHGELSFSQTEDFGPMSRNAYMQLHNPSERSVVFLRGFNIGYKNEDHHVLQITGGCSGHVANVSGTYYDAVQCRLGLRDGSNYWDDPYGGNIYYSVLHFPEDDAEAMTSHLSVQNQNSGPTQKTAEHYIQDDIPAEDVFVGLTGFELAYLTKDHHVHRLVSGVSINQVVNEPERTKVVVEYSGGLRDRSGEWDDQYQATGHYAVLINTPDPVERISKRDANKITLADLLNQLQHRRKSRFMRPGN